MAIFRPAFRARSGASVGVDVGELGECGGLRGNRLTRSIISHLAIGAVVGVAALPLLRLYY